MGSFLPAEVHIAARSSVNKGASNGSDVIKTSSWTFFSSLPPLLCCVFDFDLFLFLFSFFLFFIHFFPICFVFRLFFLDIIFHGNRLIYGEWFA